MPCQHATKSGSLPLSYQNRNLTDTFPIETATKLLQRLTASYEISQKCLTKNCMHQSHQLIRSLHSCTTSAGYEVSEARKAVLLLPRTEKSSSTSSEEHCALQAFPAHYDELREH